MEELLQIPQLPLLELMGQSARPVIVLLEVEEEVVEVVVAAVEPEEQFGLSVAISPRALTRLLQEVELQAPQVETAAVVRMSELWMLAGAGAASAGRTLLSSYNGYGTLFAGAINTTNADVAEYYVSGDPSIGAADVVVIGEIGTTDITEPDGTQKVVTEAVLHKADKPYDPQLLGIVSTEPGFILGSSDTASNSAKRAVALTGRVPVKISRDSAPIMIGDALTSSAEPGKAMKATEAGQIIGKALEPWDPLNGGDRIMVFVSLGWYDPLIRLTDTGDLEITPVDNTATDSGTPTTTSQYQIIDGAGKIIQRVAAYASAAIANLKTGYIETKTLVADSIVLAGQNLQDYIQSVVDQTIAALPENALGGNTNLISPIPGEDLTIKLKETEGGDSSKLQVVNESDEVVLTVDDKGNLTTLGQITAESIEATGSSELGELLVTGDATVSGTLTAGDIDATSSRLAYLESQIAQFEEVKARTLEVTEATVSGTLYADTINNFDQMLANAFTQPSLINTILGNVQEVNPFDGFDLNTANAEDLNLELSDLSLDVEDIAINASAIFINDYFKVNGAGYVAGSLGVGQNLVVGDGIQIGNGAIAYRPSVIDESTVLYIQPERIGTLSFLGNLMTLSADGTVSINGDLRVAGDVDIAGETKVGTSLLTNLIKPLNDGPIQVQLGSEASGSGQLSNSRFEIVDELGTPVATISASGEANFSGGVGVGTGTVETSEPGVFLTTNTAGKAYLPTGSTEVIIKSDKLTADTLIYVTPLGSTNNQVLYVKQQVPENPDTLTKEGKFVVGLDFALTQNVEFNWWIIQ